MFGAVFFTLVLRGGGWWAKGQLSMDAYVLFVGTICRWVWRHRGRLHIREDVLLGCSHVPALGSRHKSDFSPQSHIAVFRVDGPRCQLLVVGNKAFALMENRKVLWLRDWSWACCESLTASLFEGEITLVGDLI